MALSSLVPFRDRSALARPELNLFGSLHREIDRFFDEFTRGVGPLGTSANLLPSIDVTEADKEFVITAELPGLERKDVEISYDDGVLTVRGEKKMEVEEGNKDGQGDKNKNRHVTERAYGVFYRAIQLPPGVDPASVQATMSNGVLKITIPKPPHSEPKKIEIKEAA